MKRCALLLLILLISASTGFCENISSVINKGKREANTIAANKVTPKEFCKALGGKWITRPQDISDEFYKALGKPRIPPGGGCVLNIDWDRMPQCPRCR